MVAPLRRGQCSVQIMADASGNYGWGGHSSRGQFCQGVWSVTDHQAHINRKEIIGGHRSIQDMMQQGDFVHLSLDNMTAVSFINRQGGTRSLPLCKEAISLWQTVLSRGGWVRASWVPREENQLSDLLSKSALLTWDFSLDRQIAERIWARWFRPVVDAFASQECHLVPAYYSWYPDPQATARDAFSVRVWPNRVFCFPPVPVPYSNDFGQDQNQQDHSFDCGPSMETSFVVGHPVRDDGGEHNDPALLLHHSVLSTTSEQKGAILAPSSSLPCVRGQDLPLLTDEAKDLLVHDVRPGTDKIYRSRFKIFSDYCVVNGFDPTTCPVEIVTNFLSELKGRGLKYQTICGYRSAISRYHSMVGNDPIGSAPLVKRVTKACFNQAPPIPKYSDMWDVNKLMEFLETMNPNSSLSIFDLGMKAVALISSLSICRQSSVAALAPQFQVMDQKIHIYLTKLEKTSRPNKVRSEVILPSGDSHPPLSLALCLSEYIERTELRREYYSKAEGSRPSQLFISNIKPYQSVLPSTLAKWLLTAMDRAGICTASYRAHSVRSASASDMRSRGMSLSQVLQRGNWSTRTRTFAIFYDRSSLA